jgi:sugar phosphate isomerase/epimerase
MADQLALGVITKAHNGIRPALEAVRGLQIPTVQLSYPVKLHNPEGVQEVLSAVQESGVEITTVFGWFHGESYVDIPTIRATVGLVPQETRAERVEFIHQISDFAQQIGVSAIAAHIGFIPEDAQSPGYSPLVQTLQGICDALATRGQTFVLETGQETAATLKRFLDDVKRENLFVNFDPANMILYGNDDPFKALEVLSPWIRSVHCKDGCWPTGPNQLGKEVPLGEGDVRIREWIPALLQTGYAGPLTIEREISGPEQTRDIAAARDLLNDLVAKHRLC